MDGHHFDHLARLLGSRLSRRTSFGVLAVAGALGQSLSESSAGKKKKNDNKKKEKITICHFEQTLTVKKRRWHRHYPGATQGACSPPTQTPLTPPTVCTTPNCGAGCCGAETCFADTVNPDDGVPTSFGCCPATQVCRSSTPPFPDQCCYPDETCDPSLAARQPELGTICCRPCGGACCAPQDECIGGTCTFVNTARLPRTRRP